MKWMILLTIIALPLLVWGISSLLTRERELSGHATVSGHRVAQRSEMPKEDARYVSNWNYLMTFTFSDGDELELYTLQSDFQTLKDGTPGWLTWQGKRLLHFEPDR